MNIALSVCIPTFNRRPLLERSLEKALRQARGLPVEICVSNNASTDDTEKLLASLARSWPALRYENRVQNIGIDRNILAAVRMARGEYVLPIGDDEMLAAGAVDLILQDLSSGPDLLVLNGRYVEDGRYSAPRLSQSNRDLDVTSLFQAFALFWDAMPLGGFVAPNGYADARFADRYLGTHHAYSGAVWDYLLDRFRRNGTVHVVSRPEPVVEFHRVEKAWASEAGAICFEQIPRWFDLIPRCYSSAVSVARRAYQSRCSTAPELVHYRAAGQISRANVHSYFGGFGMAARLRAHTVSLIPAAAARTVIRWAHRIPRPKSD